MKSLQKQSLSLTVCKTSEHELSTNQSLQSYAEDSNQMQTTPSFNQKNKNDKFIKVTSKIVKGLSFNQLPPPQQAQVQATSFFRKIEGLCNCIQTQKDQNIVMSKRRPEARQSLVNLLQFSQNENTSIKQSLTPIGSLVNLLKE